MDVLHIIHDALPLGAVMLFGATGEIITEKSGHLNLGVPGIMSIGAISGISGAYLYSTSVAEINPVIAILVTLIPAIFGSLLAALIYAFFTISLKANQNVTGLTLTAFGLGVSNFVGSIINGKMSEMGEDTAAFPKFGVLYRDCFRLSGKTSGFGETFLTAGFLTYVAIIVAIIASVILFHTRCGMNLRAIGENPATADAAGIKVTAYKYFAIGIGGIISGIGGLQKVMECDGGSWANSTVEQYGWLAVAIVIFSLWRPSFAIVGSMLFGSFIIFIQNLPSQVPERIKILLGVLPYMVTIIVLVITSIMSKRENQPPAHLGLPYFREDR